MNLPASTDDLLVALIRHGRTDWNKERRFLGRTDLPLDDEGRAQAQELQGFRGAFDALYSSPLKRASQTASVLGTPVLMASFMEIDQGDLEGLLGPEAVARHPEFFSQWQVDPTDAVCPGGGESLGQVQARSLDAFQQVLGQHVPGQRVAIVAHQLVIASLTCAILSEPLTAWRSHCVQNAHMTWIAVSSEGQLSILAEDWHATQG